MSRLILPIAALAVSGAALASDTRIFVGSGPLNETVQLSETASVVPLVVVEDSRCPASVDCFHAGRFVLRVRFQADGAPRLYNLVVGDPQPVAGGTLTLAQVRPDREVGLVAEPDYRFDFRYEQSAD